MDFDNPSKLSFLHELSPILGFKAILRHNNNKNNNNKNNNNNNFLNNNEFLQYMDKKDAKNGYSQSFV